MLPQIALLLLLLSGGSISAFSFSHSPSLSLSRHVDVVVVPSSTRSSLHRLLLRPLPTLSTPTAALRAPARGYQYQRLYAGGFEWIDPTEEDNLNDPGVANPYKNPTLASSSTSTEDGETTPSLVVDPARLLAPRLRGCNIYLIGMMGSGKSAVGDAIARRMGTYNFLDTDTILERAAGTTISQMFESSGEEEFRVAESQVLDAVHAHVRLVIGTGGGIVIRNQNWSKLRTGLVVYLRVEPHVIAGRLLNGNGVDARPLLRFTTTSGGDTTDDDAEDSEGSSSSNNISTTTEEEALIQKLSTLITERRTKYEQADVIVDIQPNMNIQTTADAVIKSLHDFIDENPPAYVKAREKARSEGIDWV